MPNIEADYRPYPIREYDNPQHVPRARCPCNLAEEGRGDKKTTPDNGRQRRYSRASELIFPYARQQEYRQTGYR